MVNAPGVVSFVVGVAFCLLTETVSWLVASLVFLELRPVLVLVALVLALVRLLAISLYWYYDLQYKRVRKESLS